MHCQFNASKLKLKATLLNVFVKTFIKTKYSKLKISILNPCKYAFYFTLFPISTILFLITLFSYLLLSHFLFVLFQVGGVHLLKWISGRIVCLVDNGVILLIPFNDALGGRSVYNRCVARVLHVVAISGGRVITAG